MCIWRCICGRMYLASLLTKHQTTHAGFVVKYDGTSWNQVSVMLARFSVCVLAKADAQRLHTMGEEIAP